MILPLGYDHIIRIFRLTVTPTSPISHFFTAPLVPGNHYNAESFIYAANYFVEYNFVNLTEILGPSFDISYMNVNPTLDASTLSLFTFEFKTGKLTVPPGIFIIIHKYFYSL